MLNLLPTRTSFNFPFVRGQLSTHLPYQSNQRIFEQKSHSMLIPMLTSTQAHFPCHASLYHSTSTAEMGTLLRTNNKILGYESIASRPSFHLSSLFDTLPDLDEIRVESPTTQAFFNEEELSFWWDDLRDLNHARASDKSLAAALNVVRPTYQQERVRRPFVVGHRGAIYEEPENTAASFQAAADIGVDAVELDVFLLKCGTLVVFHGDGDDTSPGWLTDYCGIEANILDFTYEQARHLQFNPNGREFACDRKKLSSAEAVIPTLEDVLIDAKKNNIIVKIELKGPQTAEPVVELVDKLGMVDQCTFASFDHSQGARVRELRPELKADGSFRYRTGCLFNTNPPESFVQLAKDVGASEIHLRYDTCTKERVDDIHAAGMGSMAWFRGAVGMHEDTTNKYLDVGNEDETCYRTVLRTGVEAMCINKPDVLLRMSARDSWIENSFDSTYANGAVLV